MEKMRVLLVDDHPIIIEGLLVFLKSYPDIEIVGTASDGNEGFAQIQRLQPDCVIIDLTMPNLGGVEAIRLYLGEKPDLRVVVYTGHAQEQLVYDALQAGVVAYVLKGAPVSVLVSALREVMRGGYWLSTELNPAIIKRYLKRQDSAADAFSEYGILTDREKQVFLLLARGIPPKEIGRMLFISIKTVSKHQTAIKDKLKLKNAAAMANYAMRLGLITMRETDLQ